MNCAQARLSAQRIISQTLTGDAVQFPESHVTSHFFSLGGHVLTYILQVVGTFIHIANFTSAPPTSCQVCFHPCGPATRHPCIRRTGSTPCRSWFRS
ncbi:hypothetical protein THICB3600068 [Thiomonas sp. CB3]|nr:hypothetical protein THICB3600068 [Thiomonas sp. CB3]